MYTMSIEEGKYRDEEVVLLPDPPDILYRTAIHNASREPTLKNICIATAVTVWMLCLGVAILITGGLIGMLFVIFYSIIFREIVGTRC
jgi:hypothetical protein